jgi:nicotinamidase-related amidase
MAGEWTAQLSDDLKENEAFTSFENLSDFAKAHLETVGKATELDGKVKEHEGIIESLNSKLTNSIPKLGESPTDEEKAAYLKALGVPEKPTDYEFPQKEGEENDPKMIEWAQNTFHAAGIPKEHASYIAEQFNSFVKGLHTADLEAKETAKTDAENKLKTEWGADFDKNIEFTKRGWKKFSNTEFDAFSEETGIGNHPALIKFVYNVGQAMGEDFSPPGAQKQAGDKEPGMIYDKSPSPTSVA